MEDWFDDYGSMFDDFKSMVKAQWKNGLRILEVWFEHSGRMV
jgi:hypothetical protein